MARALRFQYPGAIYHVMARGDGGKTVFENKADCEVFLHRLGEACGSCGWRVHAWVLMGNHFHLLLETPQTNLVAGMKWLLGVFSQTWNRARGRKGHVFQGRYPRKGTAESWRDHGEKDAEDLISRYAPELGLPTSSKELEALRKGDERKALLAGLLASKTAVSRGWLGQRLGMGHPGSVSRMLGEVKRNKKLWKRFNELESL